MRLLLVTPRLPYPPLKGDQVVAYRRLRLLGRRHEVTLLSLVEHEDELHHLDRLRELCEDVVPVRLPRARSYASAAAALPRRSEPLQTAYYRSPVLAARLRELVRSRRFDLVHAYLLRTAPYAEPLPLPRVLDLIDSMQLNLERRAATEPRPLSWLWTEELRRVRAYERSLPSRFDALLVVAEADARLVPGPNVWIVPNGVDTEEFAPDPGRRPADRVVVFSGNMGYGPNVAAARWFADEVLPLVPDARLRIVGASPPREVLSLGRRPRIEVAGFVESMPAALNATRVAVAPMRSGSGIQNKVLEAMACGLPVVTTPLGLGTIGARAGEELLVADGAAAFAAAVRGLLDDAARSAAIGAAARAFVEREHSWEANVERVERVYESALSRPRVPVAG